MSNSCGPETSCTSGAVVCLTNLALLSFPKETRYSRVLQDLLQELTQRAGSERYKEWRGVNAAMWPSRTQS